MKKEESSLIALKPKPTVESLSMALAELEFKNQKLQVSNVKLNQMNLMLSVANYTKNKELEHKQKLIQKDMKTGFKMLQAFNVNLRQQESNLTTVKETIEEEKEKVSNINTKLESIQKEYREKFDEHKKLLEKQRFELIKMSLSLFKHDATVDGSFLLLSWILLKSPFFAIPLNMMISAASSVPIVPGKHRERTVLINRVTRMAACWFIFRMLRIKAMEKGWHNSVGSPSAYIAQSYNYITEKISSVFEVEEEHSQQTKEEPEK
eukprot:maker-scaffold_1-snap-gene-20.64-mRNA-1 protein AED:0.00 eAED:0.00 QI:24/1/1/1/1/1/3/53/263